MRKDREREKKKEEKKVGGEGGRDEGGIKRETEKWSERRVEKEKKWKATMQLEWV